MERRASVWRLSVCSSSVPPLSDINAGVKAHAANDSPGAAPAANEASVRFANGQNFECTSDDNKLHSRCQNLVSAAFPSETIR